MINNPLYQFDGPILQCGEVRETPATNADVRRLVADALACLNVGWSGVIRNAGYEFYAPQLVYYDGAIETKCGRLEWYAVYCSNPATIYLRNDDFFKSVMRSRLYTGETIAHEYGHHVQQLIQIFANYGAAGESRNQTQRRVELQANCWEVQVSARVPAWNFTNVSYEDWYGRYRGDATHGTTENVRKWGVQGYNNTSTGACNTWVAQLSDVQ